MDNQRDEDRPAVLRFAALFPPPDGDQVQPDQEYTFGVITPRTAHLLHVGLASDIHLAARDLAEKGDRPVSEDGDQDWYYFDRLPAITWLMGRSWRERFLAAIRDLLHDIESGNQPLPRNHAEEMALLLGLRSAALVMEPMRAGAFPGHDELPECHDDYDFDMLRELLFQDADIEFLFDPETEVFADPEHPMNQHLGIGDMRPTAWFDGFHNIEQRAK